MEIPREVISLKYLYIQNESVHILTLKAKTFIAKEKE